MPMYDNTRYYLSLLEMSAMIQVQIPDEADYISFRAFGDAIKPSILPITAMDK